MNSTETHQPSPPPASPVAIDVRNVSYRFKDHLAVDDISFQVQPRSLHGFVGPNGAGKTTSLKAICTLLPLQKGKIEVFGRDVTRQTRDVRRHIGFMPDHFSMYRQMTVFEYLDFFAAAYGIPMKQREQIVMDVLTLTDMDGRKDSLIQSLSRGMQQRVGLARVLVNDPEILLLDEPASGLDPRARIELMEILRELQRLGKTIFISSHILSELAELCDSVTIIDRGHIKYSGSIHQLLHDHSAPSAFRVLIDPIQEQTPGLLKQIPGVLTVEAITGKPEFRVSIDPTLSNTQQLLRELLDRNVPIQAFNPERKHLNQAFMDLTEQGVR